MNWFQRFFSLFQPEITTGLVENPEQDGDPRNLTFDEIAPLGGVAEVPESGDIEKGDWTLNQAKTSSCTCHSSVYSFNQATGWQLSPRYAFHQIKTDPKYPSSQLGWGAFLVDSLKLMINEGICEYKLAPNESTNSDDAYKALPISPAMEESAKRHKGGSYVYITTSAKDNLTRFDDIVSQLAYQMSLPPGKRTGVKTGVTWRGSFNTQARIGGVVRPETPTGTSSGHDILAVAWKRINGHEYLGFRNSFGPTWGDKGRVWLPKGFFIISSAITYLPPAETKEMEIVIPKPVDESLRNKHKERANAQELTALVELKFPLDVNKEARSMNASAVSEFGTKKLLFIQAVSYLGWTFTDIINYLYARSRGKTKEKAFNLDFSKQKS